MDSYVELKATGEPNGKAIVFSSEICNSWGFRNKKRAIDEIANNLTELGYDVLYQVLPIRGRTKVFKLTVHLEEGSDFLVFSNNEKDKAAVVGSNASLKAEEIIEKITSVV